MATLEAVCRTQSTLSPVQIHILQNSEELLQFASDLSHRELFVYVPGKDAGTLVLAAHRTPLLQKGRQTETTDPGAVFSRYEEPFNYQVFQTGQALQGEREIEYGRMAPIVSYPFVDNGGGTIAVIAFVGAVEDNREILTETAFLSLQVPMDFHSMYRPLSIQDGVVLVNCNGVVIYADDMADSILHMCGQRGAITGTNIYNTRLDLTGAKKALSQATGLTDDVTLGEAVVSRRVIPILQRGKVRRVISILTERTELHRKEEELMVKTSVIKEIHHRVKNNLQTIASLLRMQMRRTTSEEARDVLKESLNRILSISLVHETLSHHDEENIDISDVAQKLLGLLAHSLVSKDCHVETKFSGEILPLPSDAATSLALVLNELITNAIIHGFEGRSQGTLSITIRRDGDTGLILVCDDGVGMAQAPVDTGRKHLGMAIVRTLIEKDLQGAIAFDDGVPEGTVVTIRFPLPERGEYPMGYRVVIGDDESIIRMDLCEMLEDAGHTVVGEAADGVEALDLVRKEKPDIVLLDIKMPRLDGIHAARMIGHEGLAPVLLLTAYSQQDIVDKAKDSGVLGYLVKPVSPVNLFPAIEIAISQFRHQREVAQQLDDMNERIETRKAVDRAKGCLMDLYHISEHEAYRRLQQYSMKNRKSLKAVADAVVASAEKIKSQKK